MGGRFKEVHWFTGRTKNKSGTQLRQGVRAFPPTALLQTLLWFSVILHSDDIGRWRWKFTERQGVLPAMMGFHGMKHEL